VRREVKIELTGNMGTKNLSGTSLEPGRDLLCERMKTHGDILDLGRWTSNGVLKRCHRCGIYTFIQANVWLSH